jgi:hypothetical protein
LMPGTSFYFRDVKVTKQTGFGKFDIAGYWKRRYQGHVEDEGWYLLTNVGTLKKAVATFRCRSGIEAMFKDCKTGGYNLEKSHACDERLKTLILLIAFAYTCAIFQGAILDPIPESLPQLLHRFAVFLINAAAFLDQE